MTCNKYKYGANKNKLIIDNLISYPMIQYSMRDSTKINIVTDKNGIILP